MARDAHPWDPARVLHAAPGARGLGESRAPQLHLPSACTFRPPRPMGRRHLLPPAGHAAAPARGRARVRRHRLPHPRRRGAVRSAGAARWARPTPPATAATRAGCAAPAWASASERRPCSSPSPARRRETITLAPVESGVEEIVGLLADPPATADTRLGGATSVQRSVPQVGQPGLRLLRPHRACGSHEPRRLPRQRRLPGAGARHQAGTGRRHRRGGRLQAGGARRRGVSHRAQVGRGGEGAGAAALPGLQCRRVRARHLQGPPADGGGSLRARRGHDDRRLRHRL